MKEQLIPVIGRGGESFLDHLEELRKRLLVSLAAIGIFSVVAYFFSGPLLDFLSIPFHQIGGTPLYFHSPYEAFLAHLKVSFLAGVIVASPVIFTELWLFVAPGLYPHERRVIFQCVLASVLLFVLGATFGFAVLIPLGLKFLLGFQTESLRPLLGIEPYFSFLIGMILSSAVVFVLPIVVLGLVRLRILSVERLRQSRRLVIVLVLIVAAVLTPSPDPVSQLLLAIPLLLLYEGCLWGAKRIERKRNVTMITDSRTRII